MKNRKHFFGKPILTALFLSLLLFSSGCRGRELHFPWQRTGETLPATESETADEEESAQTASESMETLSESAETTGESSSSETDHETAAEESENPSAASEISEPESEHTAEAERAKAPWAEEVRALPPYGEEARAVLNGNRPYSLPEGDNTVCSAVYGELDKLGRCTGCEALVGRECMPTEKRGNISSVHPTGWHKDKYSFVDGESLYNRCHLIAYMFTGQNANERNLITGTRYMNTLGMNDLENEVGDYIRKTGNHVFYRVTPVFTGDNLLADGVVMEAESIEDNGEGICFCVYAYNVQPGVEIDYATGDNRLAGEWEETTTSSETEADVTGVYILNKKTKKFHLPECDGASQIQEENREEYTGSRNELIRQGYSPCGSCRP